MKCAAALSTHPIASHATGDVVADILELGQKPPALVLVFVTHAFRGASEDIVRTVQMLLDPRNLLLVVSTGVVGAGSEVSSGAGVSIFAFWSDDADDVSIVDLSNGCSQVDYASLRRLSSSGTVLFFGDSSLENVIEIVDDLGNLRRDNVLVGGLLSAAHGTPILVDRSGHSPRCVAVTIRTTDSRSTLAYRSVPLSPPMLVTNAVGAMVCELDGEPALDVTQAILASAAQEDRSSMARNLAIAVLDSDSRSVIDVHEVLGADRQSKSLAVAATLPKSTMVQLHHQTREGLSDALSHFVRGEHPIGALFSTSTPVDPEANDEGVHDLAELSESVGTSAYAGVQVATVVGRASDGPGLSAAPLSAVIFGPHHH